MTEAYFKRIREFKLNTALMILYILSMGPTHGYELLRRIREEFFFPKSPGVLYPMLRRLIQLGYIEEAGSISRGRRIAKVYKISDEGLRFLRDNRARIDMLKNFAVGVKIFEDIGGAELREAIFNTIAVLPKADAHELEVLRSAIRNLLSILNSVRERIQSRSGQP